MDFISAHLSIAAVFTTSLGVVGWIIAYVLKGWREDRTKRLGIELDQAAVQMSEFYAPLVALTDQLNTMSGIKDALSLGRNDRDVYVLSEHMHQNFFLPIHQQIDAILKSKVHLLEGRSVPGSFQNYFVHYATERAFWSLAQAGQDVTRINVPDYPSSFYHDVRRGYADVAARYEDTLDELRERRWLFSIGGLLK